jgi:iron complex outermembrane receptor protein
VPLAGYPDSIPAFPAGTVTTPAQGGIATDVTFNKLTWKAVLAQDLSDRIHAYASYNRGFKSGGFNPTSFTNPASKPEVLDAFEVGVKSELFDRKLRLNLSGFYYDYKGIQLRSTAPPALRAARSCSMRQRRISRASMPTSRRCWRRACRSMAGSKCWMRNMPASPRASAPRRASSVRACWAAR